MPMSNPNPVSQDKSEPTTVPAIEPVKKKRGFAAMDRTEVRELAHRGGVAAHRAGTAHEFTSDEARDAGRKGGIASHSQRTASASVKADPTN
jgi:general stress protein YciG